MKFRYRILVGSIGFLATSLICKGLTGSFDPKDLMQPSKSGSPWDVTNDFDIDSLLKQKFHYLARGHQAFAFVSEDGEHVLKLFKPHYPRIKGLSFTCIPFAKWLYRITHKEDFEKRKQEDFTSYINAHSTFKEESLLEYLHLAKTSDLKQPLQLFDKLNIFREFDPNETCFLIQKRVEPIETTLANLLQEDKMQEANEVLENLITLLIKREKLGFYKPTHKFHANFGCIGLKPYQLDIGNLLTPTDLNLPKGAKNTDFSFSIKKLKAWLEEFNPSLVSEVDKLILNKLSSPSEAL